MYSLIGKLAPSFSTKAVINGKNIEEDFSLKQYIDKKYVVLIFYHLDFTYVCPTELLAFENQKEIFDKKETIIIGCSVDSSFSHLAWLKTDIERGGIKGITFPLLSDLSKSIADSFSVLGGELETNGEFDAEELEGIPAPYRGLFIIDKQGFVRHAVVNDIRLGRSVVETLRLIDSLRHIEKTGETCPADWKEGEIAITPTEEGILNYYKQTKIKPICKKIEN